VQLMITHRPLGRHPRPPLIQTCFRHLPALQFHHQPSIPHRHRSPHPQTRPSRFPTSTPISNKTSGSYTYASETHNRDSANYRLAHETRGLFLGAMPPTKFLEKFLPISQDTQVCPDSRSALTSVLRPEKEVNMYAPFVSLILVYVPVMLH
jgi:hypothetical protein